MVQLIRTDSSNQDFIELVKLLDAYLTIADGDEHSFYDQYNSIKILTHVVLAYEDDIALGCGAMKQFDKSTMEIKRMYTLPESRGKGVASQILNELESWAVNLHYDRCVLETGKRQHEAIAFYPNCGYTVIPNYGQYVGIENSLCFEKHL